MWMNVNNIPGIILDSFSVIIFLSKLSFEYPALMFTSYRMPWTELILKIDEYGM